MGWHTLLPWDFLRTLYREFRQTFFTKPKEKGPYFVVDAKQKDSVEVVKRELGQQSWAPNWEFSYNKRGEVLNLAYVVYWDDHDHRDNDGNLIVWWQSHVRAWRRSDGALELSGHWEPEPTEYDVAHLEGVGFDKAKGMRYLGDALDEADGLTIFIDPREKKN